MYPRGLQINVIMVHMQIYTSFKDFLIPRNIQPTMTEL